MEVTKLKIYSSCRELMVECTPRFAENIIEGIVKSTVNRGILVYFYVEANYDRDAEVYWYYSVNYLAVRDPETDQLYSNQEYIIKEHTRRLIKLIKEEIEKIKFK